MSEVMNVGVMNVGQSYSKLSYNKSSKLRNLTMTCKAAAVDMGVAAEVVDMEVSLG